MSTVKMMRALPQGRHIAKAEQWGMALLEALIALLIFSIAVLGLVGIQANMVTNTTEAQFRSIATYIAQQKIGRIWANPSETERAGLIAEETVQAIDQSLLPSGFSTVSAPEGGMLRVTVTWGVSECRHRAQIQDSDDVPDGCEAECLDDDGNNVCSGSRENNVTIDARVMEGDES
ncbi:type IV pilus modification protein PilV [Thauera sp. 63]|uniref:type IV pilus modification protein PilV n=1 Tax=Thauera sp. 63 TaxID=497321 RepID=UPI0002D01C65|nr:type IV pilus modification protein PilV [Thauera sp. 63]ENO80406.1 hypothetical protein C664_01650 [Thauera sp. 63]